MEADLKHIEAEVMRDEKWFRALRKLRIFRHIPFVEFVLVAGSMAMDTANDNSDVDIIVGARFGRIFTARLATALTLGLFGWRRKKPHGHKKRAGHDVLGQ